MVKKRWWQVVVATGRKDGQHKAELVTFGVNVSHKMLRNRWKFNSWGRSSNQDPSQAGFVKKGGALESLEMQPLIIISRHNFPIFSY